MNDGGPAFPDDGQANYTGGRSLRDWFAGQSDIPWGAVIETLKTKGIENPTVGDVADYRAALRYMEADAMLAERAKRADDETSA